MEKKKGMKNIFKKLHIGSNHDPNRSSTDSTSTPASSSTIIQPSLQSPSTAASPPPTVNVKQQDYYSSEEEYQVQLALALSVSNSESPADSDSDQIRAAKLLSLGQHSANSRLPDRPHAAAADKLSRQYWVTSIPLIDADDIIC